MFKKEFHPTSFPQFITVDLPVNSIYNLVFICIYYFNKKNNDKRKHGTCNHQYTVADVFAGPYVSHRSICHPSPKYSM